MSVCVCEAAGTRGKPGGPGAGNPCVRGGLACRRALWPNPRSVYLPPQPTHPCPQAPHQALPRHGAAERRREDCGGPGPAVRHTQVRAAALGRGRRHHPGRPSPWPCSAVPPPSPALLALSHLASLRTGASISSLPSFSFCSRPRSLAPSLPPAVTATAASQLPALPLLRAG